MGQEIECIFIYPKKVFKIWLQVDADNKATTDLLKEKKIRDLLERFSITQYLEEKYLKW